MAVYVPPFLSEFPDAPVTDCVPASGVMLADKVTHGRYPASVAEREALQNAMGTQDQGANTAQLAAGLARRYGLNLPTIHGWSDMAATLADARRGLSLIGSYQKLPAWVRNHGNQPTFNGLHCIYAQGDGAGRAYVGDPLASSMLGGVALTDLQAYASTADYGALVATEQATIVGYRVIPPAGRFTVWLVTRWAHVCYGPLSGTFSGSSWAPARHGAPGFWLVTAGPLANHYAVYGRSQAFRVEALWSSGARTPVSPAS